MWTQPGLYPAVAPALGWRRGGWVADLLVPPTPPRLSVVIITKDRKEELLRTLDQLASLPERPPVVVVANGCTDGTEAAVARRHPAFRLLALPANLGAAGRNLGTRAAGTEYVAYCDDDTWWEPGSLRLAGDVLDAHPQVAVVTGHIVVEPGGGDDPVCAELRGAPLPRPAGVPGYPLVSFLAGASVVRARAVLGAGGFDPVLHLGGEEELLAVDLLRQGWLLTHLPGAVVHHQASTLRDPHHRRRKGIRNTLWFAWLRRPVPAAARRTVALLRRLPRDAVSAGGVADALRGATWVAACRRRLPAGVAAMIDAVEDSQLDSPARRYVS